MQRTVLKARAKEETKEEEKAKGRAKEGLEDAPFVATWGTGRMSAHRGREEEEKEPTGLMRRVPPWTSEEK